MAAEAGDQVEGLFDKLDKFVRNDQHRKAIKTADEILKVLKQDDDASHVKIVAHVNLGEWDSALALISKSKRTDDLRFEKAYCLYKLGQCEEALKTLQPLLADDASLDVTMPALELAAQVQYRQGRTQECIQLYDKLIKKHKADSPELKTNVLAAYVAGGLTKEISSLMSSMRITADKSFEIAYNHACALVQEGQWATAETELRKAIKKGRETLFEEECTEEEVEEELSPLTVQLAYVLGRQGKTTEAQTLYDNVLRSGKPDTGDEPTKAVATNNSFVDSGRIDGTAAHKKTVAGAAKKLESFLENAAKPGLPQLTTELEARLSITQKQLLTLNRALTYVLSNRLPPAKELADYLNKSSLPNPHLVPMLQAAIAAKEGNVDEADAILNRSITANPSQALEPSLARVQMALDAGNTAQASQLLSTAMTLAGGSAARGGMVVTQVSLLQQLNDNAGAESLLSSALSSLRGAAPTAVSWCLQALMDLQLRLGKTQAATDTWQQLQATGIQSAAAASLFARLLHSVAGSGNAPSTITTLSKGLPNMNAELRSLDVDLLESGSVAAANIPTPAAQLARLAMEEGQRAEAIQAAADTSKAAGAQKKKKSKKRKRLPKAYDPALPNGGLPPPDPERWMPKWQRTDVKKKKLKSTEREKGGFKGGQGAGKVNESLDRTKVEAAPATSAKPTLPPKKKGKK